MRNKINNQYFLEGYISLFAVLGPLPLLVLGGGGALVVVVARAVPLAAGSLGSALSTEIKFFLKTF